MEESVFSSSSDSVPESRSGSDFDCNQCQHGEGMMERDGEIDDDNTNK